MKILLIALCILFLLAVCKKVKTTSAKGKEKGCIIGEIQNDNDRDIDNVGVTIIFRDDNGKLAGGTSTLVRSVSAKSAAQYQITLFKSFETDKFELYANIWG